MGWCLLVSCCITVRSQHAGSHLDRVKGLLMPPAASYIPQESSDLEELVVFMNDSVAAGTEASCECLKYLNRIRYLAVWQS
jgi:hypothetical protein